MNTKTNAVELELLRTEYRTLSHKLRTLENAVPTNEVTRLDNEAQAYSIFGRQCDIEDEAAELKKDA